MQQVRKLGQHLSHTCPRPHVWYLPLGHRLLQIMLKNEFQALLVLGEWEQEQYSLLWY